MTEKAENREFTDQMGYKVNVAWPAKRIISLVPSQTELLSHLGLEEEVVGITKFCVHPEEWFRTKKRVGGTKKLDMVKIEALQPDVIIGNKEENTEEQIKELMKRYPVWMSDIHNLDDAEQMMLNVGKLVDKYEKAVELVKTIRNNFKELSTHNLASHKVAYFIWREPYMTVGGQSFINSMLKVCNLENVFADVQGEYPQITPEQIKNAAPDILLLSSEPYPFGEKHKAEFAELCPNTKIVLVDGEYFSWYGSRLLGAPAYFQKLMNDISNA
jgi:ABC-type Fe3+-hydroxamate transport system substrate-binding protein